MANFMQAASQHINARFFVGLATALIIIKVIMPEAFSLSVLDRLPEWGVVPFADWINASFTFMQNDLGLVYVTRSFAAFVSWLLDVTSNLLYGARGGFNLPTIPWTILAISGFVLGYALRGWRLSLLSGGVFVWLAVMGQWKWAMQTLSVIMIAAPLAVMLGFMLGLWAWRSVRVERILNPLLNIAQSLPHFSYMIPVVVFFGVGDHAGAIATIVFATPPMIRMTVLGLKKVPAEIIESGHMCGATRWQIMAYVRAPSARADILLGINQVIMQCLAMIVLASFIGMPGLGYKLLQLLQSLKFGRSIEIGISIVLLAIMLDRCSKAWIELQPQRFERSTPWWVRKKYWLVWGIGCVLALIAAQITPYAYDFPRTDRLSVAPMLDSLVDILIFTLDDFTLALREFLILYVLIPIRSLYLFLPQASVVLLAVAVGWVIGKRRSALVCLGFIGFIALSGWWDRAMITAYMVSFSVLISVLIGVPLGIWSAKHDGRARAMLLVCDTAQTFPSFIYLIPMIMLFQVNDVSAIAAVITYGTVPILRYTIEGLRNVPAQIVEAADMSGTNAWQKLIHVRLPLAMPVIMVGLNQTVMFSLFMVIIAAFIGTQDLGQEMMRALSSSDVGKGLVLGFCVAFMGLMFDHLAMQWAKKRNIALGLVKE